MSDDDSNSGEQGCGCLAVFGLSTGVVVWTFAGLLGFWKALLAGIVMNLTSWLLAAMGLIPYFGQQLYKQFAEQVISWVYGLLQVNPYTPLVVPAWINFFLKWFLAEDEITGTLGSYIFRTGYALSVTISISVVVIILIAIFRKKSS